MLEGDCIAMLGVPLIAAGDPEVAANVEGDGTDAPGDGAHAAEEATRPTSDEVGTDKATEPSDEAGRLHLPPPEPMLFPKRTLPTHLTRSSPLPPMPKKMLEATPRKWCMPQSSKLRCSPLALLGTRAPRSPQPTSRPQLLSPLPKPRSEVRRA
jgi:hypothetical protein